MRERSIGERFEQERLRLGFRTRRELAQATGLRLPAINAFEDHDAEPARLAEARLLLSVGMDLRFVFWGESPADERRLLQIFRGLDVPGRRAVLAAAETAEVERPG